MSARVVDSASLVHRDEERALAKLKGMALRMNADVKQMQALTRVMPMPIRIECNNVMECLDLLRHRLHEETLRRVLGDPVIPGKLKKPLKRERQRV
jgi:hypothetical protein